MYLHDSSKNNNNTADLFVYNGSIGMIAVVIIHGTAKLLMTLSRRLRLTLLLYPSGGESRFQAQKHHKAEDSGPPARPRKFEVAQVPARVSANRYRRR
jgi:hypothetical protein